MMRLNALASLATYAETFNRKYTAYRVHRVICAVLELVELMMLPRVAISLPPRTGKSLTTTTIYPAFALARNPAREIIQGGFSSDLSTGFSVKTKALLQSARHRRLIGDVVAREQNRQDSWKTIAGGEYFATSVGSSPVGRGSDLFLIDDVFASRADARSPNKRKAVREWWESAVFTRLTPSSTVLVIGTRWHKEDLIGYLTSEEYNKALRDAGVPEEQWFEVNIQAICEDVENDLLGREFGQSYWPERWSVRRLIGKKQVIGPVEWASQYQGKPRPEGGQECDASKLGCIDASDLPENLQFYRAWDLALGVKESSDWSVGARCAIGDDGTLYIRHVDRRKRRWLDQKQAIISYAESESVGSRIAVEGVAAWQVAIDELNEHFQGRVSVRSYKPSTDKVVRATPWLALVDAGKVKLVRGPWNEAFRTELEDFPGGSHDDQIDAVSICYYACKTRGGMFIA